MLRFVFITMAIAATKSDTWRQFIAIAAVDQPN
jgi:hypothetical protein